MELEGNLVQMMVEENLDEGMMEKTGAARWTCGPLVISCSCYFAN